MFPKSCASHLRVGFCIVQLVGLSVLLLSGSPAFASSRLSHGHSRNVSLVSRLVDIHRRSAPALTTSELLAASLPCETTGVLGTRAKPVYRPTRRWPTPAAATAAIVLAVGGLGGLPFSVVPDAWQSWKEHFLPRMSSNTALILVIERSTYFEAQKDISSLEQHMQLEAIDCATQPPGTCALFDSLDSGYSLYHVGLSTGDKALVLVTLRDFDIPYWVASGNMTEYQLNHDEWMTKSCGAPYSYVKYTSWSGYQQFRLEVLRMFDFFIRVDNDIVFKKAFPFDLTHMLAESQSVLFHSTMNDDPPECSGPGLHQWLQHYLGINSELCGQTLIPVSADDPRYQDLNKVYYSNFIGGWLGFYTSPQYLGLARAWDHHPDKYAYRWSDQQIWTRSMGLFHSLDEVKDLTYLRNDVFEHL